MISKPEFVRIYREDDKEFRQYGGFLTAVAKVRGEFAAATETAFYQVYDYLSGHNDQRVKIPFRYPVYKTKDGDLWVVSIMLPPQYDLKTAPLPLDPRVTLRKIAPRKVAVIEYGFQNTMERIQRKQDELFHWLKQQSDFAPVSAVRLAQYESSYPALLLGHNEIQVDVRII